jgi:hypothetical protein
MLPIFSSSGPMSTISGVLESCRAALLIRRTISLIGANLDNHPGQNGFTYQPDFTKDGPIMTK